MSLLGYFFGHSWELLHKILGKGGLILLGCVVVLLALLIVALLFGLGFAVKVFWLVALVALALWLIGFVAAGAERRWYHW